jgi:hypothetical protein
MKARHAILAALAAAVLVVFVSTASAFGTVHDLFGNGKPHVQRSFYTSEGQKGSFTVRILFMNDAAGNGTSEWRIVPEPGWYEKAGVVPAAGQYVQVTGRGRVVRIGGHEQAWHARLEGFVTRPGEAKQRVVITMKGRPKGVFVLTPLELGVLKRDSGTLTYSHATG